MPYQLDLGGEFILKYAGLPADQQNLIKAFIAHYRSNGLDGWRGKIARTDNVPLSDQDRMHKIWWANRHNLWHAHVGHPYWSQPKNEHIKHETSDWVVHFQKLKVPVGQHIALIDYDHHNPMSMPTRSMLFRT
nr:hypothetical protein [uncultured Pseudomonas sp.]